jgi:hypothetical protein
MYYVKAYNITVKQLQVDWLVAWDDSPDAFRRAGVVFENNRVLLNLDRVGKKGLRIHVSFVRIEENKGVRMLGLASKRIHIRNSNSVDSVAFVGFCVYLFVLRMDMRVSFEIFTVDRLQ